MHQRISALFRITAGAGWRLIVSLACAAALIPAGAAGGDTDGCEVTWQTARKGQPLPPAEAGKVRLLAMKKLGTDAWRSISAQPVAAAPSGWAISTPGNSIPACSVHVLLEIEGLGKLDISDTQDHRPGQLSRRACMVADDGPTADAQAVGLCVQRKKPDGRLYWEIRLP